MSNMEEIEMRPPRQDPAAIYQEGGPTADAQQPADAPVKKKKCCQKQSRFEKNKSKYQEKIDQFDLSKDSNFKDGMVMERKPTDLACCIALVIFVIAWIAIDAYAISTQDMTRIYAPLDATHNFCGMGDRKDYKYLYFTKVTGTTADMYASAVCVKFCPNSKSTTAPACFDVATTAGISCPTTFYHSTQLFSVCIPEPDAFPVGTPGYLANQQLQKDKEKAGGVATAFKLCAWQLGVCFVLCIVGNIGYIYLMSRQAECLGKVSVVLIEIFLIVATLGFAYAALKAEQQRKMGFAISALVMVLFTAIFNCMLYCYYTQFKIAIAVIDAAADFYADTKRIILVSMMYFVISLVIVAFWFTAAACLYGMNDFRYVAGMDAQGQGRLPVWKTPVIIMFAIKIFVIYWVLFFISCKLIFITMVSASTYYFSSSAEQEGSATVLLGFKWAYGVNAGSIAFGSLVQAILALLRELLQNAADSDSNEGAAAIIKCVALCLLRCIEGIVDYVNKLALAQLAISGEPYCTSAWNGFMINLKHCVKFYFAQDVGGFFVFMGNLTVTGVNTAIFYLLAQTNTYPDGISYIGPLIAVIVASLVIGSMILGLFDEAIMATLHCFALDMDVNGSMPKWGPPSFHEKMKKILEEDGEEKMQDDGVVGGNNIN